MRDTVAPGGVRVIVFFCKRRKGETGIEQSIPAHMIPHLHTPKSQEPRPEQSAGHTVPSSISVTVESDLQVQVGRCLSLVDAESTVWFSPGLGELQVVSGLR